MGILGDFVVWFGKASARTSTRVSPTRFGDYLHVRLAHPDTRFFSAFGYAVANDSSTPPKEQDDYLYVEFGREVVPPSPLHQHNPVPTRLIKDPLSINQALAPSKGLSQTLAPQASARTPDLDVNTYRLGNGYRSQQLFASMTGGRASAQSDSILMDPARFGHLQGILKRNHADQVLEHQSVFGIPEYTEA